MKQDLEQLAHQIVTDKIASGELVRMHWAIQELIDTQGSISGEGAEFYWLCAQDYSRRLIKRAVESYEQASGEEVSDQMLLEGYDCLMKAYSVRRDDDIILVPTGLCTDQELLTRATVYRKQSSKLIQHAKELEEFVARRAQDGQITQTEEAMAK